MSMPCYLGGKKYINELADRNLLGPVDTTGIKFIPSRPGNPSKHGLPRATALIIILDPETLIPMCVMDGAIVSAMRTGAASGVAAKYLANPDSEVMGLVGASVQGRTQLLALKAGVPSLKICKVFDLSQKTSELFTAEMSEKVNMKIVPVKSVEEAFRESDVISTATMAREAYVKGEWYKHGAFHAEISFWDTPPSDLKGFDRFFVDDWYHAKHHGVDVSWRAVKDKYPDRHHKRGPSYTGIANARPETVAISQPPEAMKELPYDVLQFIEKFDDLPYDAAGDPGPGE